MVVEKASKSTASVDDTEDQVTTLGDSTGASVQDRDSATEADAASVSGRDLPRSNSGDSGTVVTALLTDGRFEFVLTDSRENSAASVANTDYHALFVRDREACACLEQYDKATSALRLKAASQSGSTSSGVPALSPPLTGWLRRKDEHTRVLLTPKKDIPADVWSSARRYVRELCEKLGLSDRDRDIVTAASDIHNLVKYQHPDIHSAKYGYARNGKARTLQHLSENPTIVGILRSMYRDLGKVEKEPVSLELMGANMLTIVDLLCDTCQVGSSLTRENFTRISGEFERLIGKLFLKHVAEAFIFILDKEALDDEPDTASSRALILTDDIDRMYPLEARLRNEGFRTGTCDSLEFFAETCKLRPPQVIVIRQGSSPREVARTLQYLIANGINVSSIPTYLLVKGHATHRLITLLDIGIEDVLSLDCSVDHLILKIRKIRTRVDSNDQISDPSPKQESGSRGSLSDMNLIDLLQALGPSQRTTWITIERDGESQEKLEMFLSEGSITFAELGELRGERAIYEALKWDNGTWVLGPVKEEEIPEPNNTLSNEAILMEGCRLIDEGAGSGNND